MCRMGKLKEVKVDIILDLEVFDQEYGSYIEKLPSIARVRPLKESICTSILRDVIGKEIFKDMNYFRPDNTLDEDCVDGCIEQTNYVMNYLFNNIEKSTLSDFYTMRIRKSDIADQLYFLEIILKEGFLAHLKINLSENIILFLQDILRTLYENGITDSDIVGYYMNLTLLGTETFKNNFTSFFQEKHNVND